MLEVAGATENFLVGSDSVRFVLTRWCRRTALDVSVVLGDDELRPFVEERL